MIDIEVYIIDVDGSCELNRLYELQSIDEVDDVVTDLKREIAYAKAVYFNGDRTIFVEMAPCYLQLDSTPWKGQCPFLPYTLIALPL